MSKLIFPKHGGILVDDNAQVVKTANFKTKRGSYIIKIVKDPRLYSKPYGYHYLGPDNDVTANDSVSHDPNDALTIAKKRIKRREEEAAATKKLKRRSSSQIEIDKLKSRMDFFLKNHSRDLKSARDLALAEKRAEELGWIVEWHPDPDPYESDDDTPPNEVLYAVLKNTSGEILASLSSIADPSKSYARVVEAELALEALESM